MLQLEVIGMVEQDILQTHRDAITRIAGRHGVIRVRIVGSVARGEATPESDIDLLVETGPETSAWFPAGLILDLEQLLGRRVEVVTERALNPAIRERVLQEARTL
jgi:predicted nucleotidyltransferase